MMETIHVALDQWRALIAVVEAGGYAQAAAALHKSQSAVTYAVQKIEEQLGVKAFEIQGRKAALTSAGHMLYRRAQILVNDAVDLEKAARTLSAGWEAEIGFAVEVLFPTDVLLACLASFGEESPQTRIEIIESVIEGTPEALLTGQADLAITPRIPPGFFGELLTTVDVVAVAASDHPLHCLGRALSLRDLAAQRHLTVRDTGSQRDRKALSVEVQKRWTVSNMTTAIEAACHGYGFCWLPVGRIQRELDAGLLKPLPLKQDGLRKISLYLVLADPEFAGPGVRRLAEVVRAYVT